MRKQPKTDYPFNSLSCRGDLEGQNYPVFPCVHAWNIGGIKQTDPQNFAVLRCGEILLICGVRVKNVLLSQPHIHIPACEVVARILTIG